jgi:hypothetical protein
VLLLFDFIKMNSLKIKAILSNDAAVGPIFLDVFPSDQLPRNYPLPCAFVANMDPGDKPGKHWVAFHVAANGCKTYFDSYGKPPNIPTFVKWLGRSYTYNGFRLQSLFSSACGQFCIYFLTHICRGYTLKDIIETLDADDSSANDELVTAFVNQRYDVDTKTYDLDYIIEQICGPEQ